MARLLKDAIMATIRNMTAAERVRSFMKQLPNAQGIAEANDAL